jgi:hypothetical protein
MSEEGTEQGAVTVPAPKWGSTEMLPLPARFNSAVRALAAERAAAFTAGGTPWRDVVFDRQFELFDTDDARAIERAALDEGYRFDFSAVVSLESEPDKYKHPERTGRQRTRDDEPAQDGRRQVGVGDNVIRKPATVSGPVQHVRTVDQVMAFLDDGVPPGTIAIIDDSGGTLTAPIVEEFAAVLCLGGTTRSHLGILAREYDVPTLMNCRIDDLSDGDVVELEVTVAPPAADAYETGDTGHARIWLLED